MPMKCTAQTSTGDACPNNAITGTEYCNSHTNGRHSGGAPPGNQNRTIHGYYRRRIPRAELDGIEEFPTDLSEELNIVRITVRKLLSAIEESPELIDRYAPLVFAGTRTIARLASASTSTSDIDDAIGAAIDEIMESARRRSSPAQ